MARLVTFKTSNFLFQASVIKVDRNKVYGWVENVYTDVNSNECDTGTLLNDGKTLVVTGGIAQKVVDSTGLEVDKSSLIAKNADLSDAQLYPSIYDEEVILVPEDLNALFDLDVTAVYELGFDDLTINESLKQQFSTTQVYSFLFNYRADYEASDALLIMNKESFFVLTGKRNSFEFLCNTAVIQPVDEAEAADEDDLDFGMF
jgi:hypothetical protein